MKNRREHAVIYARELPIYPEYEVLGIYFQDKWTGFDDCLKHCQESADTLIVACPEVLGDDYLELLVNLSKIASAGLVLSVVKPSGTIKVKETLDNV